MDLSTELLRTFVCVSEEKGFSNAAIKLHKSQSSISTQIKLLEKQLGSKLFDRSEHPPELTEIGRAVLQFAKEFINRTRDLERDLKEFSLGVSGEVRVGTISSISTYLLLPTIGKLLRKFPKLKVSILNQSRSLLFESVRQAAVDFAIVLSDREPENLAVEVLKREQLCFVVSPENPLGSKKHAVLEDLAEAPFVVGLRGSEYAQMIDRLLKQLGLNEIHVSIRISNWEGIKEAVRAGIGLAILPRFVVERDLNDRTLAEVFVRDVRLRANIMLLENSHRRASSATVSLIRNALVQSIVAKDCLTRQDRDR
jgi:LysR family transcriptional regulator, transcriptional activator of the cysJI operon